MDNNIGLKENNLNKRNIKNFELNIEKELRKKYEFTELQKSRLGFYFTSIGTILGIDDSEIFESITDTQFNEYCNGDKSNDFGIDAIYINKDEKNISLFAFKFRNQTLSAGQGNEMLEKLQVGLMPFRRFKKYDLEENSGKTAQKTNEILDILKRDVDWNIKLFLVSNEEKISTKSETGKYLHSISKELDIEISSMGFNEIYNEVFYKPKNHTCKFMIPDKAVIEGRIEGTNNDYYVIDLPATTLIRICLSSDEAAMDCSEENLGRYLEEYQTLEFNESILEENVRGYLGTGRSKYNKQIITTLEEEPENFILYNNGLTILCEDIDYKSIKHSPNTTIEIQNMKIVNGGQTARVLHEYYKSNDLTNEFMDSFLKVHIQVKINKIKDIRIKDKISEYTNSQNAIKAKDLHSNDSIQKEIEKYMSANNILYQRKNGIYSKGEFEHKIEMEDFGQYLFSINGYPYLAINKKKLIFEEKYHDIFTDANVSHDIENKIQILIEINQEKINGLKLKKQEKQYVAYGKYYQPEYTYKELYDVYHELRRKYIEEKKIERPEIQIQFFNDFKKIIFKK